MTFRIAFVGLLTLSLLAGCDSRSAPLPAKASPPTAQVASPPPDPSAPLPWSSSTYFDLHADLLRKGSEFWLPAVAALEQKGDRFTLFMIDEAQRQHITPEKLAALERLSAAIRPKFSALAPEEVQVLLERDAYADMMCPDIEYNLRDWTRDFLTSQVHRPEIRQELERLQKSYVCDEKILYLELAFDIRPDVRAIQEQWYAEKVQFHSMNDGVKERAELLLVENIQSTDL
jgi:hypothetical protein